MAMSTEGSCRVCKVGNMFITGGGCYRVTRRSLVLLVSFVKKDVIISRVARRLAGSTPLFTSRGASVVSKLCLESRSANSVGLDAMDG